MSPKENLHESGASVVALDGWRQDRRLAHLLELRAQLAVTAAAHHAHDLPDAGELARQQYGVEETIREGWPGVYAKRWTAWVEQDAAMLHASDTLIEDCAVCTALARHVGVNIRPPEAA